MQNLLDKPIFVTGLPGPETTLVAELLHSGGAWIGNAMEPGPNQRTDPWRNRQISDSLIKPILAAMQCDPLNASSLPPTYSADRTTANRRPVRGIGEALHAILRGQGYDSARPWLYQDPNLLLLWPNFVEALPVARWLVVRRKLDHFIQSSALQRPGAGHTRDEASRINLGAAYLQRIDGLRDYNGSAREVWMDDLATGVPGALLAIFEHLDLSWDPRVISQIVERGYRQDRVLKEQTLEAHTSAHTSTSALRLVKHYRTGQHYTFGGSVALVGNSDGLAGRRLGPQIDQYDHVFRFNLAPAGGKFSDDVGSKATCYYLNKNITLKNQADGSASARRLREICRSSNVICHPGHYTQLIPDVSPYHFEMGVHDINDVFLRVLGGAYTPFPHGNPPRNGIKLLAALIDAGCRPSLFGFDLKDRQRQVHYFDEDEQIESQGLGHQPSREYRLLNQLRHRDFIEVVNPT